MKHIVDLIREVYDRPHSMNSQMGDQTYCVGGAFMLSMNDGFTYRTSGWKLNNYPPADNLAKAISFFKHGHEENYLNYMKQVNYLVGHNDTFHYERAWKKLEQILGEDGIVE